MCIAFVGRRVCDGDCPLWCSAIAQLGVVEYRTGDYGKAEAYFVQALNLAGPRGPGSAEVSGAVWDATLTNLGMACHKQQRGRSRRACSKYAEPMLVSVLRFRYCSYWTVRMVLGLNG